MHGQFITYGTDREEEMLKHDLAGLKLSHNFGHDLRKFQFWDITFKKEDKLIFLDFMRNYHWKEEFVKGFKNPDQFKFLLKMFNNYADCKPVDLVKTHPKPENIRAYLLGLRDDLMLLDPATGKRRENL